MNPHGGQAAQAAAPQRGPLPIQFRDYLFKTLEASAQKTGWQTALRTVDRASRVSELYSSILLLRQYRDPPAQSEYLRHALHIEGQAYSQQHSQQEYMSTIHRALLAMKNQREKMAQSSMNAQAGPHQMPSQVNAQLGVPNSNPLAFQAGQDMTQSGFQADQQRMNMQQMLQYQHRVGEAQRRSQTPNFPAAQANMQSSNVNNFGANTFGVQPPPQSQQANGLRLQPLPGQDNGLPADVNEQLNHVATEKFMQVMRTGTVDVVRKQCSDKMGPALLTHLRNHNIDPLWFTFRQQASNGWKQRQKDADNNPNAALHQSGTTQNEFAGGPTSNQRGQQPGRIFDPSQIAGLQAEAQRSQAAGNLVVPASNNTAQNSGLNGKGPFGGPNTPVSTRPGQNLTPEELAYQIAQRDKVHRATQAVQASHAPNGINQKQPNAAMLQGQFGGLHAGQPMPQQSPNMSMLNRPFSNSREQSSSTPQNQALARPQNTSQSKGPQPQVATQMQGTRPPPATSQLSSGNMIVPPSMTNAQKQRLSELPPQEARSFVEQYNQQQQQLQRAASTQQFMHQRQSSNQQNNFTAQSTPGFSAESLDTGRNVVNGSNVNAGRQPARQPGNLVPPQLPVSSQNVSELIDTQKIPTGPWSQLLPDVTIPADVTIWKDMKYWMVQHPKVLSEDQTARIKRLFNIHWTQAMRQMQGSQGPQPHSMNTANMQSQQQRTNPNQASLPSTMMAHNETTPSLKSRISNLEQRGLVQTLNNGIFVKPPMPQEVVEFRRQNNVGDMNDPSIHRRIMGARANQIRAIDSQLFDTIQRCHEARDQQQRLMQSQHAVGANGPSPQPKLQSMHQTSGQQGLPISMQPNQLGRATPAMANMTMQNAMQNGLPGNASARQLAGAPMNGNMMMHPNQQAPNIVNHGSVQQQPPLPLGNAPQPPTMQTQREQFEARMRTRNGQADSVLASNTNTNLQGNQQLMREVKIIQQMSQDEKYKHFDQLSQLSARKCAQSATLSLDPAEAGEVVRKARPILQNLQKIYGGLREFFVTTPTQDRNLYLVKCVLESWHKVRSLQSTGNPPRLTLSLEDLKTCIHVFHTFLQTQKPAHAQKEAQQSQSNNSLATASQTPTGQNKPQATAAVAQPSPAKPSATKAQVANIEKKVSATKRKQQEAPPAPTSSQPPAGFGEASPHGTPNYGEVTSRFKRENMSIPPSKRRKQTQTESDGSTPVPAQVTPPVTSTSPEATTVKASAPTMPKQPAQSAHQQPSLVLEHSHKCPIPSCEFHTDGFITKDDKDQHCKEAHNYENNPLQWCLSSMKTALSVKQDNKKASETAKRLDTMRQLQSVGVHGRVEPMELPKAVAAVKSKESLRSASSAPAEKPKSALGNLAQTSGMKRAADSKADDMPSTKRSKSAPPGEVVDPWAKSKISKEAIQQITSRFVRFIGEDVGMTDPPGLTPSGDTPQSGASLLSPDPATVLNTTERSQDDKVVEVGSDSHGYEEAPGDDNFTTAWKQIEYEQELSKNRKPDPDLYKSHDDLMKEEGLDFESLINFNKSMPSSPAYTAQLNDQAEVNVSDEDMARLENGGLLYDYDEYMPAQ
ncbi:MAG: hypothetical protein M1828_007530 [Chrysothrix sp. TS-e1954]|nr:MAG: hypothetical protein M1828_007530 [Chrysothrix sp. TS-e1954]